MRNKGLLAVAIVMTIGVSVCAQGLVINEIAWAGTAASSADEWIELFNPTDQPIDLSGWTLSFGDVVIDLGAADGAIVQADPFRPQLSDASPSRSVALLAIFSVLPAVNRTSSPTDARCVVFVPSPT